MMAVDPESGGGGAGGGGTRGSDGSSDDGRHRSTIEMDDPDPGYASDSGEDRTRTRIGVARWRRYQSKTKRVKAYSWQLKGMIRDAVRMARTTGAYVAMFFIPESGKLREFATGCSAVQFMQIFDGLQARARLNRANVDVNFTSIQREFARGGAWLDDAVQRLRTLGVSRGVLERFHAGFRANAMRYHGGSEEMATDISERLEHTMVVLVNELEAFDDMCEDVRIIDLTTTGGAKTVPAPAPAPYPAPSPTPAPAAQETPAPATTPQFLQYRMVSPLMSTQTLKALLAGAMKRIMNRTSPDLSSTTLRTAAEATEILRERKARDRAQRAQQQQQLPGAASVLGSMTTPAGAASAAAAGAQR